jgi:hypothetical protein
MTRVIQFDKLPVQMLRMIGELTHMLSEAAVAAIESGEEAINQRTLLLAPYTGPAERRRMFERALA